MQNQGTLIDKQHNVEEASCTAMNFWYHVEILLVEMAGVVVDC